MVESFGGELIIQKKSSWGSFNANYSYFKLDSEPLSGFSVSAQSKKVLGIPNHMLKLYWDKKLNDTRSIYVEALIIGRRYACASNPDDFICAFPEELDTEKDIKIYYHQQFTDISLGIGIANILDSDLNYIQPYRGGQTPTPGLERRLIVDLEYQF